MKNGSRAKLKEWDKYVTIIGKVKDTDTWYRVLYDEGTTGIQHISCLEWVGGEI
jgi:hypothetical protein